MTKTVILKDGPNGESWCELEPVEGGDDTVDRAIICRGTYGAPGDVVAKPCLLSWSEAAFLVNPTKTLLSPSDLHFCEETPQIEPGTLLRDLEDTRGTWNSALALAVEDEKLGNALQDLLGGSGPAADSQASGEAA